MRLSWVALHDNRFIKCCSLICIPIPRRQLLPISSWTRSTTGSTEAIVQATKDAALLSAAAWATLNGLLRLLVSMLLRSDFDSTCMIILHLFSLSKLWHVCTNCRGSRSLCAGWRTSTSTSSSPSAFSSSLASSFVADASFVSGMFKW